MELVTKRVPVYEEVEVPALVVTDARNRIHYQYCQTWIEEGTERQ